MRSRRALLLPAAAALGSLLRSEALRAGSRDGAGELRAGNSSLPQWHHQDGVCADAPHGWTDSMGNTCVDYEQKFYCTKAGTSGAGWWPVWGALSNYAAQNRTAAQACCACGGGLRSCCPERRALEALIMQELAPLHNYTRQLEVEVAANVSAAGAEAAARHRASMASQVSNASQAIVHASTQLRGQALARARQQFDNQTVHRENLTEAAEAAIVQASYAAVRGAVGYGAARLDTARLSTAMQDAAGSIHKAASEWEKAATTGKEVAQLGTEAVGQYFPRAHALAELVGSALAEANTFLSASETARQQARLSEQAMAVAADASEAAHARAEAADAQVRQAMARAQAALRATGANVGKLNTLEAMVAASEAASSQVSGPAR